MVCAGESLLHLFLNCVLCIRTVSPAWCLLWELYGKAWRKVARKCPLGYLVPTARLALELPQKLFRNSDHGEVSLSVVYIEIKSTGSGCYSVG